MHKSTGRQGHTCTRYTATCVTPMQIVITPRERDAYCQSSPYPSAHRLTRGHATKREDDPTLLLMLEGEKKKKRCEHRTKSERHEKIHAHTLGFKVPLPCLGKKNCGMPSFVFRLPSPDWLPLEGLSLEGLSIDGLSSEPIHYRRTPIELYPCVFTTNHVEILRDTFPVDELLKD